MYTIILASFVLDEMSSTPMQNKMVHSWRETAKNKYHTSFSVFWSPMAMPSNTPWNEMATIIRIFRSSPEKELSSVSHGMWLCPWVVVIVLSSELLLLALSVFWSAALILDSEFRLSGARSGTQVHDLDSKFSLEFWLWIVSLHQSRSVLLLDPEVLILFCNCCGIDNSFLVVVTVGMLLSTQMDWPPLLLLCTQADCCWPIDIVLVVAGLSALGRGTMQSVLRLPLCESCLVCKCAFRTVVPLEQRLVLLAPLNSFFLLFLWARRRCKTLWTMSSRR